MAAKKTSRSKARKTVSRAKATRKTSARSARRAPKGGLTNPGTDPNAPIMTW